MSLVFYKNEPTDKVWWAENPDTIGEFMVSFDKKTVLNLFSDYPHKFTDKQKLIFDRENPFWADLLKERR